MKRDGIKNTNRGILFSNTGTMFLYFAQAQMRNISIPVNIYEAPMTMFHTLHTGIRDTNEKGCAPHTHTHNFMGGAVP